MLEPDVPMGHTVLITGSSGMIGAALSEHLLELGYDIIGFDSKPNRWSDEVNEITIVGDLRNPEGIGDVPRDVDTIVHLAANARVHKLVENPKHAQDNLNMTFNVLEWARQNDVSNIIFGSSREVYGNKNKFVYSEDDTYVDECESPYTASKVGGEAMVKAFEQCYGIDSCILRFSNVYGRYDVSDRVVPLFITRARRGMDLTVYGDSKVLDFTYLDDCVSGIMTVINDFHKSKRTTFNLASGKGTSLVELAEKIAERFDHKSEISVDSSRTGEVGQYVADISKATKVLGYEPEWSLAEGLDETIAWHEEHRENFEKLLL